MNVTLTRCDVASKQTLHHLYQFYLHDLSAFTDELQVEADGAFDTSHIDIFWEKEPLHPFLVRADGKVAGFALVAGRPYAPEGADYSMVEFFILKRYRRQGVGREAARLVFDQFRGAWDVYELEANLPAIRFWNGLISEYTEGRYTVLENGHRQRFTTP
ncbi:MAG TPA: GNAT family N-acetyltransferase [Symbiobacteriaceae bacterium]|nr:GNAT family N-acetyltransferase [Symbiobacteriaceae bacterium]